MNRKRSAEGAVPEWEPRFFHGKLLRILYETKRSAGCATRRWEDHGALLANPPDCVIIHSICNLSIEGR
jgi:hypothetical protein